MPDTDSLPPVALLPGLESLPDQWSEILVEISPGIRRHVRVPAGRPPRYLVQRLLRNPRTGEYFAAPTPVHGPCVRLTKDSLKALNLPIAIMTLKRLIYAGFVRAYRVAPNTTLLDVASLYEHLEACEVQPGRPLFWSQDKLRRWLDWRDYGLTARECEDDDSDEDDTGD